MLPLLPARDDIRLFVHTHKQLLALLVFVAKVAPHVGHVLHSHISDQILARKQTDVFEKFPF